MSRVNKTVNIGYNDDKKITKCKLKIKWNNVASLNLIQLVL